MPRRKKGRKKNRISKDIEANNENNNKIKEENIKKEDEIKDNINEEPKINSLKNNEIEKKEEPLNKENEEEKIKINKNEEDNKIIDNNNIKTNENNLMEPKIVNDKEEKLLKDENALKNEIKDNEEIKEDIKGEIKDNIGIKEVKTKVIMKDNKNELKNNIETKEDKKEKENEEIKEEIKEDIRDEIKEDKIEEKKEDIKDQIEEKKEEIKDQIEKEQEENKNDNDKTRNAKIKEDENEAKNKDKKEELEYNIIEIEKKEKEEKKEEDKNNEIKDKIEIKNKIEEEKNDKIDELKNKIEELTEKKDQIEIEHIINEKKEDEIKNKIEKNENITEEIKEDKKPEIKEEEAKQENEEEGKKLKNNDKKIENKENKKIEENNNVLKIANIEYEKFIKENSKLFQYIKKINIPIIIQNLSSNKKEEINLKNCSLLKIIKQSSLENEFKIYITIQIITETVEFETSSSKKITFNPTVQKFIKNINNLIISFPKKNKINDIIIQKEAFVKIFSQMEIDYNKNIFNYMEFIITEISYELRRTKKVYVLKGVKSLKKLIEQNKLFYINKNYIKKENLTGKNINNIIPLSNYTTQKIFNLFNGGKDTKFLLLNYKIKDKDFINYENKNQKYLNKLIIASDVKSMLIKYEIESKKDSLKLLKQEKLNSFSKVNILDLENYLNIAEKNLFNIKNQIKDKKKEISNLCEDPKNQFIEFIDSEKNKKFINNQYIKLMKGKDDKFNKNIYSFECYDYNNEKITILNKDLEDLLKEENIYVEIKINEKNYLVNKNKLLKIFDSWKILKQEDNIDGIDSNNIKNKLKEYDNEKLKIKFMNVDIILQDAIKEIKFNENDENKSIDNLNDKKEKEDNNLIIIEEEENIIGEEDKILRNAKNESKENINSKLLKMIDYFNNLPKKNSYNIKLKVKSHKIPKKK